VLLGWPLLLSPVHVVFLELLIDPACSIAFEAEGDEPGILDRPPRTKGAPMFDRPLVVVSLLQGCSVLAVALLAHFWLFAVGGGEDEARAAAFAALIAGNVGLIVVNRSWTRPAWRGGTSFNLAALVVIIAAIGGTFAIFEIGALRSLFQFAWPDLRVLFGSMAAALLPPCRRDRSSHTPYTMVPAVISSTAPTAGPVAGALPLMFHDGTISKAMAATGDDSWLTIDASVGEYLF